MSSTTKALVHTISGVGRRGDCACIGGGNVSMNLKTVTIANLKDHPDNPNTHPPEQIEELKKSADRFGQVKNIVIWRGFILAGHAFRAAAVKAGRLTLEALDVSDWPEDEAIAYMLADIRLPGMALVDDTILAETLRAIDAPLEIPGFDEDFLAGIGFDLVEPPNEPPEYVPPIDKAAELQAEYGMALGQVWQLGQHRLAVGDCTDKAVVEAVMGEERSDICLFTDPPYGVKRDEGFGGFGGFGTPIARKQYRGGWDKERPSKDTFDYFINMTDGALIFGGNFFADILPKSTCWLVWDKLNTMPTFGDCELIWTNLNRKSVKKITFEYNGLIGKETERFHATQKPTGLMLDLIDQYIKSSVILDPFLGSGTTLIAAHQLGRRCRGIELDPGYAAVTLKRWEDLTNDKAELL